MAPFVHVAAGVPTGLSEENPTWNHASLFATSVMTGLLVHGGIISAWELRAANAILFSRRQFFASMEDEMGACGAHALMESRWLHVQPKNMRAPACPAVDH